MKKLIGISLTVVLVLVLTLSTGAVLAGPALHKASGGGTVDWTPDIRVTYGFTAQQIDENGNATGEYQENLRYRDWKTHGEIIYLVVDTATGDAWLGGVTERDSEKGAGWEFNLRVQDNGEGSKATGPDMISGVSFGPPGSGTAAMALSKPNKTLYPFTNGNIQVK